MLMILQVPCKGPSIKYVHKIFRKTNISNPLIRIRGLKILVFRKILRTYLMDDPLEYREEYSGVSSMITSLFHTEGKLRIVFIATNGITWMI